MEGLKFANKLSKGHVQFHFHKMNVSIAAQTLSSSVADAIVFLSTSKYPGCEDVEGTVKFIRTSDRLFYMMNTKSLYGKGFKKPLVMRNFNEWNSLLREHSNYLSKLTDTLGTSLLQHRRKIKIRLFAYKQQLNKDKLHRIK